MSVDSLRILVGKSALVQVQEGPDDIASVLIVTSANLRRVELPELKRSNTVDKLERLYGIDRLAKAKPLHVRQAGQELGKILRWL